MEAGVRCERVEDHRLPPAFDCAGEPQIAGGVLPPALNGDDVNAFGTTVGEEKRPK